MNAHGKRTVSSTETAVASPFFPLQPIAADLRTGPVASRRGPGSFSGETRELATASEKVLGCLDAIGLVRIFPPSGGGEDPQTNRTMQRRRSR